MVQTNIIARVARRFLHFLQSKTIQIVWGKEIQTFVGLFSYFRIPDFLTFLQNSKLFPRLLTFLQNSRLFPDFLTFLQNSRLFPGTWNFLIKFQTFSRLCGDPENCKILSYADDITLYFTSKHASNIQVAMNQDISKLEEWFLENRMKLNETKTELMVIQPKNKDNIVVKSIQQ